MDESTGGIQCLDPFVPAPPNPASWYGGFGPGDVPGCRRAVCECDRFQLNSLKTGTLFFFDFQNVLNIVKFIY